MGLGALGSAAELVAEHNLAKLVLAVLVVRHEQVVAPRQTTSKHKSAPLRVF